MSPGQKSGEDLFLTFDVGTQSVRCALIDVAGTVIDFVKIPIQAYFSENQGWAEQRPDYYWSNLCAASRQVIQRNSGMLPLIRAVAVSSQRGTYINLDKDGNPLRPAITWLDQRLTAQNKWAPFYIEAALKAVGLFGYLDNVNRQCYSNWIRQNQPEIWDKTYKYVILSAYLHYMLTGNIVESLGNNFGYIPINSKTFRWADKKDLIRLLFPIDDSKLPDLAMQGEVIGSITKRASAEAGIPLGLPVVAAAGDKSCEILGAGCMGSDTVFLSFGTCSTVNAVTDSYVELIPFLPPYPAAVPGYYVTEIPVMRGFWMVSWFKEEFGLKEQLLAKEQDVPPEMLLDDMIKNIPAGSGGLMLQPYWSPYRVNCGEEGRGSVIGFSGAHTRAHLYRAILEGIMYGLKDGARITTNKLKKPFTKVRVSGGGAQSRVAVQIAADVFDLPVECPTTSETSALGAAINAAVGLGYYPDYISAVNAMTGISRVVNPIPRNRDIYSHLYNRIYRKMYARQQPLFKELHKISGLFPGELRHPANQKAITR